jgi:hypothetical protein
MYESRCHERLKSKDEGSHTSRTPVHWVPRHCLFIMNQESES